MLQRARNGETEAMLQVAEMQFRSSGWGLIAHNPVQARRWTEFAASKGDVTALHALRNMRVQFEKKRTTLATSTTKRVDAYEFPHVEAPDQNAARVLKGGHVVPAPGTRAASRAAKQSAREAQIQAVLAATEGADPALAAAVRQALDRLKPTEIAAHDADAAPKADASAGEEQTETVETPKAEVAASAPVSAPAVEPAPPASAPPAAEAAPAAARPSSGRGSNPYSAPLSDEAITAEFPGLVKRFGLRQLRGQSRMKLITMQSTADQADQNNT